MAASVILTVYDREPEVLLATLRSLWRSLDQDDEVIVANDRSHLNYEWVVRYAAPRFEHFRWIDVPKYEAFTIAEGFKNPAKAFNAALALATRPKLFVMSSDTLVTPQVVKRAKSFDLDEMAWTPLVIDLESNLQYCGPDRLFPAPWFLACSREKVLECGGWDENYLKGMCYEDNDFIGRVLLHTGRFIGDWSVRVYHQSHDQIAYKIDDPEIRKANDVNRAYTMEKWSGIPFSGDSPFDILRKPHPSGNMVHECKYYGTLLGDCIAKTKSEFVRPVA